MKSFFPHLFQCSLMATGLFCGAIANASTLVAEWGGDYISGSYVAFDGTPTGSAGSITRPYSMTNPLSTAGVPLYGGASLISVNSALTPSFTPTGFGLVNHASGDYFSFVSTGSTEKQTLYGLVFMTKDSFLNGASTGTLTLDNNSQIVADVYASSAGSTVPGQPDPIRRNRAAIYALKDGEWGWYLSQTSRAGGTSHTFADLAGGKWAAYDPTGTPFYAPPVTSAEYDVFGTEFEDIGAVGLFFHYETAGGADRAISYGMRGIRAEFVVTPIPEPATTALAVGSGMLLLIARRLKTSR